MLPANFVCEHVDLFISEFKSLIGTRIIVNMRYDVLVVLLTVFY